MSPRADLKELPKQNVQDYEGKVEKPDCFTRDALNEVSLLGRYPCLGRRKVSLLFTRDALNEVSLIGRYPYLGKRCFRRWMKTVAGLGWMRVVAG